MKVCGIWIGLLGLGVFLLPSLVTAAPDAPTGEKAAPAPAEGARADEADHEALRAFVPLYEKAAAENKPELLKPYLAPNFSGVMVTGDEVHDYKSLEDYCAKIQQLIGEGGKYHVTVHVAERSTISGDLAVAHGTTDDEVLTSTGKTFQFTSGWTAVCQKQDGQWKILRIQGTMDPVGNAFVKAGLRSMATLAGLLGGLVGLLLGMLLHVWIARRRRTAATA